MKPKPKKEIFGLAPDVKDCAEEVLQYLYERNDPIFFAPCFVKPILQQAIDWLDSTPMVSPEEEHEMARHYRERFDEKGNLI